MFLWQAKSTLGILGETKPRQSARSAASHPGYSVAFSTSLLCSHMTDAKLNPVWHAWGCGNVCPHMASLLLLLGVTLGSGIVL